MKRTFDLIISAIGLICLIWLIFLLALLVRSTSRGPGIFKQHRVGLGQRIFTCYKLRTMHFETSTDATHNVSASSVTGLGRLLRRLKLDELPQLWNVFKGDMSLVGPRPCLPLQTELIEERQLRGVFSIRPGITGLAQVQGIDMSEPKRLAEVDAEYLAQQSLLYDLSLIIRTLGGGGSGDRIRV
ncbi:MULTISPECIES: sugar transferase [unclassified Bradyrhizobium]|uniref:sugar transferase n=1 Tax=unclassified Bradyrhizobium TaxID=2631580 RepID=UPI002479166D|nr:MULTISPECIES: sugar transferase [unclassified Bradyrhizobium]WGS22842.1 sugar transferase [Bradyrhizobium sp. ISRA463]WGS29833.1 sugar transferase [Bradyrhizobium sp. ISRA464]